MAIDILFVIMTVWGLYFGYTYGPIKVFLMVVSVMVALAAAMRFTPLTEQLISDTFEADSPFLPFLAFILTLLSVLFTARIVSLILLETITNQRFNKMSQYFGALVMSATFVFLFSVLVSFFQRGEVIKENTAQSTSFFYKYIVQIPTQGRAVLSIATPMVEQFIDYMNRSIDQFERGKPASTTEVSDSTNQTLQEFPLPALPTVGNPRIDSTKLEPLE